MSMLDCTCPNCGARLDGHDTTDGELAIPANGDTSLCIYCGSLLVYEGIGENLTLRKPTAEELHDMLASPDIQHALQAWRLVASIHGYPEP
jgi:hypothetical protein